MKTGKIARIVGIDTARGIAIIAVLVFSLWRFFYYAPPLQILEHNASGKFMVGDLIFPVFIFISGMSLWLYVGKLRGSAGKIAEAEGKYLALLIFSLLIASMRLFIFFPDEVTIIAVCGLVALNIVWAGRREILIGYVALAFAAFAIAHAAFPQELKAVGSGYLGGWLAIPYYLALFAAGTLAAMDAFPKREVDNETGVKALLNWAALWLIATVASSLIWPIDKMGLSPSFIAASALASLLFVAMCVWAADLKGWKNRFLGLLGANSLYGWVLLCVVTTIALFSRMKGAYPEIAYFPFCAFLVLALYAALEYGKVGKKRLA